MSTTWKTDARRRPRIARVTATLTFRVTADAPEQAIRDAVERLEFWVAGAHVDYGGYEVELVESRLIGDAE